MRREYFFLNTSYIKILQFENKRIKRCSYPNNLTNTSCPVKNSTLTLLGQQFFSQKK